MIPTPVFFGHDERQVAGTSAFLRSVIQHAKRPLALVPITATATVAGLKEGTNSFTYRRFLVPWMMNFTGFAIFVDGSDMLCRGDINELADLYDPLKAVQVVKHDYKTRHPRKYLGTGMEADNPDYERKNWVSVMIINCAHFNWRHINPEYINSSTGLHMLQLRFIEDQFIGSLPMRWNWLVDEHDENHNAKICHWTGGHPGIPHYYEAPMAPEWHAALASSIQVSV